MLKSSPKPVACKHCRQRFTPFTKLKAKACSVPCALALVEAKKAREAEKVRKVERAATKAAKERIKTRRQWLDEAQTAFNRWVRLRDSKAPCISCQRHHMGQYHAGHYLSTGARPELRFHPDNCHKQCSACNSHLSGNVVLYRMALVHKIGQGAVDWLEGPHEQAKFTIDDLREIRDRYRRLAREIVVTVADSA